MGILHRLADNQQPRSLANYLRRKRFSAFQSFVGHLPKPIRVLDVGGTESFWRNMGYTDPHTVQVTLVNVAREPVTLPNFDSAIGDARALPQYKDGSFDVAFSNSVIEHVGSFEDQQRMAREVQRLGALYFLQTPARSFPIEPHFLFPGFQFFPRTVQSRLVKQFSLGWFPRQTDEKEIEAFLNCFRLLTFEELRSLFPSANIECERFCGFTKSYIVRGVGHASSRTQREVA